MVSKPPVTLQDDWEAALLPWLRRVAAELDVGGVDLDVDRVHEMTGVVAEGVQRSMAPISAFLVGAAVARGAGLEDACRMVEQVTAADAAPVGS
ncbi:hypothetical protein BH708_05325 [Brachybacterium sp. P6-10-X1]|uniref:DUF6457 domain-containing protein n=1 Tax=Brachybacterium sp. P6-10-X1 TaxID=1903186 RepID=UPI000971BDD6|nr:DUF6457 domain-containing protein [Brachybacterium sp. P6-10-X1]APX32239.1 hypothetical protein BH708_05325 [Brachybacterium sp. P6-10-X1]